MKTYFFIIASIFLPVYLFAGDISNTDIIPRTINFLVFFGIMYWLLKSKISNFLHDRSKAIEKSLNDAEADRVKSQKKLLDIKKKLSEAKKKAIRERELAKGQAKGILLSADEIKNKETKIQNQYLQARKQVAQIKFHKQIVSEFLNENIDMDKAGLNDDKLQTLLLKKAV